MIENPALDALSDPADPRFGSLLAIYEASIPARERKPEAAIAAMAASPSHHVIVACAGETVVGFALLYVGRRLALLEYLATSETVRGRGLGVRLYRASRSAAGMLPLVVEVESDREPSPDRQVRCRRIAFYRRLGCRRIGKFDFILPLDGAGAPPLLDLLVDDAAAKVISAETLGAWLHEMYVHVYGCRGDDPRLRTMMRNIAAPLALD